MQNEQGRSMVETLATLAIMGILSVMGIAGFSSMMDRNKANTLIQEAQRRAVIVAGQIGFQGQTPSLAEFSPYNATSSGTFGDVKTTGLTKQFGIEVSGVKKRICENILQTIGENTPIRRLSKADTLTTPITSCDEDNAFLFIYNNDMTGDDKIEPPRSCRTVNDCASACATCEIPEDEEVGICINECEEPVKLCEVDTDCNTENECMMCDTTAGMCKNGCERVEYLESTGTQYIDTRHTFTENTIVRLEGQFTGTASNSGVIGAIGSGSDFYIASSPSYNAFSSAVGSSFRYQGIFDINRHYFETGLSTGFYVDNDKQTFGNNSQPYSSNIALFRRSSRTNAYGKIYYCKIWDNGTLVRDFVPVIAPSGKACMLNRVPEDGKLKLYCDANGGTFKTNKDK